MDGGVRRFGKDAIRFVRSGKSFFECVLARTGHQRRNQDVNLPYSGKRVFQSQSACLSAHPARGRMAGLSVFARRPAAIGGAAQPAETYSAPAQSSALPDTRASNRPI